MTCSNLIPGSFIMCGEGGNFCSSACLNKLCNDPHALAAALSAAFYATQERPTDVPRQERLALLTGMAVAVLMRTDVSMVKPIGEVTDAAAAAG